MSRILKITFFILNIIYGEEEENRRNSLFLNAKFGNDNNTYISRVYSSLCDIIKGKNFEILEKKDLIDNEKKFIISTFKIIDNLLLDESKDPSDLISMIINFPSLRNSIIDKKNAEILFTVKFIQFIFFLEDIEDFSSIFQQTKYDFPTESEISVDTEEKKAMELLNNRIDMFFSISDEMLKKNNHEYWKISKVLEFTESLSNKERGEQSESSEKKNLIDNLNEIFISNDFLRVSNKTTNFAFSEDELKTDNDVTSFVTISSFCIQKIFKYLVPQKKTTLDENNVIYELGNLLDRKIPNEGEIYVPNEENKLLLEFIARLFYCLKSYSPESICINVSNYEKDLKISFSIQRNSWNLISESNSVMIRYLCLLNQILHRKYREYYINKISIDNLIMYGNEIYNEVIVQSNKMESNENIKTTGSLRKKGSLRKGQFISHTGSLGRTSSVRKRLSHLFRNPTDKQKNDSFEMFDEVKAKEDFDKQKLIEALQKFNNSINHEEIDSFLHFNASMNNCDLLIAVGTKKFPGFFEVINYFVDYGTSGYSIDLQSDAIYITKKAEIERKMELLSKEEYDLEAIKSYFKIDILNEKDEVMISGALLLSMASYFNIPHSQSVYDCLILLRRYIEGNLHNKENFNRKEVINVILRSIEINRKRSRYLSRLIYIKLREMMKK